MKMPWKIEKRPVSSAEQKLQEIRDMLFPPLELNEELGKDGNLIKYHIDYSVDSNIDAALADLYDGNNDSVVQSTLNKVNERLNKVRRMLEAYPIIDDDAKYIIVDTGKEEDVQAREG